MNFGKEFKDYSVKHLGLNSLTVDAVMDHQVKSHLGSVDASMTPYILEEREMRVTQMDIFSRLMSDRILVMSGVVDQRMSTIVQSQLIFLDSVSKKDITMHIDSGGGSVAAGLSMIDVMDYIACDIQTINMGLCASMGAVLLASGTKGKRSSLRFSRTMVHQSSGGAGGHIKDAEISFKEWQKYNDLLFNLLGQYTGKDPKEILEDSHRDKWFWAQEALDYGLIDEIIKPKGKKAVAADKK